MDEIQLALKDRFPQIHPLIFQRCLEKAKSNGDLFDLLDSFPEDYPVTWDDDLKKWATVDLLQIHNTEKKL